MVIILTDSKLEYSFGNARKEKTHKYMKCHILTLKPGPDSDSHFECLIQYLMQEWQKQWKPNFFQWFSKSHCAVRMCPGPFIQVSIHIQKTLGCLRLILQVLLAEAFQKNNEKAINFENTCKNHDFNTGGMTVGMGHSTRILTSLSAPGKVLNSHFHILTFSPPV